jgi:hypothetical protein
MALLSRLSLPTLFVILGASCFSRAGEAGDDGFQLRQTRWEDLSTGQAEVKWGVNLVTLSVPGGAPEDARIECTSPLNGDFDAQVSFDLLAWEGDPEAVIAMAFAATTPEETPEAQRQVIRIGRLWADAVDQYDARALRAGRWRMRTSAIEFDTQGRLQIMRRRGQVRAGFRLSQGWQVLQIFETPPKQEVRLQLSASNGGRTAHPSVRVRFYDLKVEQLPDLKGAQSGVEGAQEDAAGKDWVIYGNDLGWLRLGSRAQFKAVEKKSGEIFGGSSEDPLSKTELKAGFRTREEALRYLCDRLTKVHLQYMPLTPPYEIVRAMFEGEEYYLGLQGTNDPEVLRPAENYDLAAEKAVLRAHGVTPRVGFRKLWIVHATGHGTVDGPVKDDRWMTITRPPVPDEKRPGAANFEIADGLGGTFTYLCDKWEGPYRDNFGLAQAMRRLYVSEVELSPPGNRYTRRVTASEVPEHARDFGSEVLGVQPIVDSGEMNEWVAYVIGDVWLRIGTRTEFANPYKRRETLLAGPGEEVVGRVLLPFGRTFSSCEDALEALCAKLTNVQSRFQPGVYPAEVLVGTAFGKSLPLHLGRDPDALVAGYSGYDLGSEMRLLASRGIASSRVFRRQWLVHATGHGTYSGRVKDDLWMMVLGEPRNGGVEIPDGMGGTFGYSVDQQDGPFTDNLALSAALRRRQLKYVGLAGEDRRVFADEGLITKPTASPDPPRILSITPDRGEAGQSFYVTVIATGMKPGYRFRFGPGVTVSNETNLGKDPDGPGERWLATLTIDRNARFEAPP